jgi:putative tryptophan/tyrosine transport system substrate-binding protein
MASHIGRRKFLATLGGAAAAWPLVARAQQPAMPVIGWLSPGSRETDVFRLNAFARGLNETGHSVGRNVAIEHRWAENQIVRLPTLAADLVYRPVNVIVAVAAPAALAAKAATTTIPIVFVTGIDPAALGLVASLSRPGGNVTGLAVLTVELAAKRVQLLHELLPTATVIAVLVNPDTPLTEPETSGVRDAAGSLGLQLHVLNASTESEIDKAFKTLVELRAGALVVQAEPFLNNQRAQIVALAARHAVPAIYAVREFATAGGLMSYGGDLADAYRQVGIYAGKILTGTKPADLPVQQVVRVEFVINLRAAKALGLTFPITLLGRADEVIE